MKEQLLNNWSIFRALRTALGIFIVIQGIITHDSFSILLGTVFSGMALFNMGCCATGSCANNHSITGASSEQLDISFEEVKEENHIQKVIEK